MNCTEVMIEKYKDIEKSRNGVIWLRLSDVFLPGVMISQPEILTSIICKGIV
jgi:hypothetical protein